MLHKRKRSVLGLETLEGRAMLAASVNSAGDLVVSGSNSADSVTVSSVFISGVEHYQVTQNGASQHFRRASVWGGDVFFYGYGGDDYFSNNVAALRANAYGGDGNDTLWGDGNADMLSGGNGNDILHGWSGNDLIFGGEGNDFLYGESGNDELQGGNGNDQLVGSAGDDRLFGQGGADRLFGELGNDQLIGGEGNDELIGGDGHDRLWGEAGWDWLWGGAGNDYVDGGSEIDFAWGGTGADTFVNLNDVAFSIGGFYSPSGSYASAAGIRDFNSMAGDLK